MTALDPFRRLFAKALPKGGFKREAAILGSGTLVAQIIGVAASPLVARLYGPSAMGIYATAYATASLYSGFSTLRFELRIPAVKQDSEARTLLSASTLCPLLFAFPFFGALAASSSLRTFFGLAETSLLDLGLLLAFAVLMSLNQGLVMYMGRLGQLGDVAKSRTVQVLGSVVLQVVLGFAFASSWTLLAAGVVSQALANRFLAYRLHQRAERQAKSPSLIEVLVRLPTLVRESWHYVLSFGIGAVAYQLPVMTVASAFGTNAAGQFGLAQRMTGLPVQLLSQSLGEAFRLRAAKMLNSGQATTAFQLKVGAAVVAVMLPAAILFWFLGEQLFTFAFGPEWQTGGSIAAFMLLAAVITLSASITDKISVLVNARRYVLAWQTARLVYTLVLWRLAMTQSLALLGYVKWLMICYSALYLVDFVACLYLGRAKRTL
ncbi:MAG: lipopolysaccharide biosynthesis protein [Silvanigrellales bacterium]|nr:lipopolysaccharide biosynthesis protein [Silvanigrellales bacterium]